MDAHRMVLDTTTENEVSLLPSTPVLDLWSAFEALRRLGFSADDIYFVRCRDAADPEERFAASVELRCQSKTFTIIVPSTRNVDPDRVSETMKELQYLRERWDLLPQEKMLRHFQTWLELSGGAPSLVMALLAKGFILPKGTN